MAEVKWFPANRGRIAVSRTSRRAVEQLLEDLGDLDGTGAVMADLARGAADLVDAARARQDPRLWLSASAKLEQLLAKLPGGRGGADPVGGGDQVDEGARLAELVGRGPTLGDETEPAAGDVRAGDR